METIEGNKIIAEFMGAPYDSKYDCFDYENASFNPISSERYLSVNRIKYHSSWDWLMPVVEKIEKESKCGFHCRYYDEINWGEEIYVATSYYFENSYNKRNRKFECKDKSKIAAYHKACVEYIKYKQSLKK
jgi:hypothetical protein